MKAIRGQEVETRVEVGGGVTSRQGLNVPGELTALPAVAEDDLERLRFGETIGVDLVALSFVRRPDEITDLREHTGHPAGGQDREAAGRREPGRDRRTPPTA